MIKMFDWMAPEVVEAVQGVAMFVGAMFGCAWFMAGMPVRAGGAM